MLLGGFCYPLGYVLAARQLGGAAAAWDYFQQTQRAINAFSEQPDLGTRVAHVANMVGAVFENWFHHALIFGEHGEVPGGGFKMSLLLGAPLVLWARAEWRRPITRMAEGTLLSDAGLRAGDVLTRINGTDIDGMATLIGLWPRLQSATELRATVLRNGQPFSLVVSLR